MSIENEIRTIKKENDFHEFIKKYTTQNFIYDYLPALFLEAGNPYALKTFIQNANSYKIDFVKCILQKPKRNNTSYFLKALGKINKSDFIILHEAFPELIEDNKVDILACFIRREHFNLITYFCSIFKNIPLSQIYKNETEESCIGLFYQMTLYRLPQKKFDFLVDYFNIDLQNINKNNLNLALCSNDRYNNFFETFINKIGLKKYFQLRQDFALQDTFKYMHNNNPQESMSTYKINYLLKHFPNDWDDNDLKSFKHTMLIFNNVQAETFDLFYQNGFSFTPEDLVVFFTKTNMGKTTHLDFILERQPDIFKIAKEETIYTIYNQILIRDLIYSLSTVIQAGSPLMLEKYPSFYQLFIDRICNAQYNKMLSINKKNFESFILKTIDILSVNNIIIKDHISISEEQMKKLTRMPLVNTLLENALISQSMKNSSTVKAKIHNRI